MRIEEGVFYGEGLSIWCFTSKLFRSVQMELLYLLMVRYCHFGVSPVNYSEL